MLDYRIREAETEPYLFVSFYSKDSSKFAPVLEKLYVDGIRIWYADGETGEETAKKLKNASAGLFFFSPQSVNLHSFANALIYAVGTGKPVVSLFLEEMPLPVGMDMQVSQGKKLSLEEEFYYTALLNTVCIKNCKGPVRPAPKVAEQLPCAIVREKTGEVFRITEQRTTIGRYSSQSRRQADIALGNTTTISRHHAVISEKEGKFYIEDTGSRCGTCCNGNRLVSSERVSLSNHDAFVLAHETFLFFVGEDAFAEAEKAAGVKRNDDSTLQEQGDHIPEGKAISTCEPPEEYFPAHISEKEEISREPMEQREKLPKREELFTVEPSLEEENKDPIYEMTVRIKKHAPGLMEDPEGTIRQIVNPAILLRLRGTEAFVLNHVETIIGRKSERKHADVMLDGNPEISREHATIYQYDNKYLIRDNGSLSGTTVDGKKVGTETAVELLPYDIIGLAAEKLLFLCGLNIEGWINDGKVCTLKSLKTGEIKALDDSGIRLDRNHPWKEDLLKVSTVSRDHAVLFQYGDSWYLRDVGSTNGTSVNGVELKTAVGSGEMLLPSDVKLHSGDKISISNEAFRFSEYQIQKEEER